MKAPVIRPLVSPFQWIHFFQSLLTFLLPPITTHPITFLFSQSSSFFNHHSPLSQLPIPSLNRSPYPNLLPPPSIIPSTHHQPPPEQLLTPMRVVVGGEEVVDVWAGGYSSFALTSSGKVYAWGLNNYYQLGSLLLLLLWLLLLLLLCFVAVASLLLLCFVAVASLLLLLFLS